MKPFASIAIGLLISSVMASAPANATVRVWLSKNKITQHNDGGSAFVICTRSYSCYEVSRSEDNRYPLGDDAPINSQKSRTLSRAEHMHYSKIANDRKFLL